uniref:Ubiquitin-like protease family profile domain-containing protein n=1 Tax=Panagrolaimus davidi TaxID=227884 RepID=A0A914PD09_9BILA
MFAYSILPLFNVAVFLIFSLNFSNNAPEIVKEKNYCILNIGGGKRRCNRDDEPSDAFEEPSFGYLKKNRKIFLLSEKKHKTVRDLYLDDNQVDALICGVAAFVSRKGIRKVSVLTSHFCTKLAADPETDPITYMHIYKSNFDILLAPIVEEEHWYVAAFYVDTKIVTVYDSLHWPVPSVFPRLKKCIESVLHLQFTLKNDNRNITKQQNGFDCGINAFRNAEEICFHGKCNLISPYYPEAERARAREILIKLTNKQITDEWVPRVVNSTDYTKLNKPTDEPQKEASDSDSDSIKTLDDKKTLQNTVPKADKKADEANICNIHVSIGCLNDPIQKMSIDDSVDVDEDNNFLTDEEKNETQQKVDQNFIDYCNRKRIRKDSDARKEFNAEKNAAKAKLAENEKLKVSKSETETIKPADDKSDKDDKEYEILSVDEEAALNKEVLETAAEFCNRKRIKNDTKGKAKHKQSAKDAKEKLANNEKAKEYMIKKIKSIKTEDGISDTVINYMEVDENVSQNSNLMTNAEEIKVQNDAKETFAAFCKRLKISTKKSRNKYNAAIKNAQDKLAENARLKECMKKRRLTESAEEKKDRLKKAAESMQTLRDNETEEEKSQRLQKKSEAMQKVRDNETDEDKSQRLIDDKTQKSIKRTINKLEKQEKLKKDRAERIAKIKELLPFVLKKAGEYTNVEPFKLGKRDKICKGCGAKHYRTEKRQKDGTYTSCCKQGKIKMEAGVADFPENLKDLMTKKHANKEYMKVFNANTRMINSSLSCAHMYAKNVNLAPGVPYLKIQGKVLHKMSRTYLPTNNNATFGGQNYIVDSADATIARVQAATKNNIKLNEDLMKELDETIREVNIFAKSFTMLKETMEKQKADEEATGEKPKELRLVFKGKPNAKRNYDRVEAENEIALVYTPGPDGEIPRDDIVIFDKKGGNNNTYEVLPEWDPRVEPLSYTLFYPNGKGDFYSTDRKNDPNEPTSGKLTEREYYAYKINERCEEVYGFNPILYGGKLFLQYLCDAWAKVEGSRLRYLTVNQKKLKVASYKDVQEHLNQQAAKLGRAPGSVKILPSTFYGGPRYLRELCSDAISMVDEFGKPTALVTMTVNPEDEDIIMNIYEDQKAWERPDIVNSCFYQKLHELIRIIEKEQIFGPVECSVVCIEFQKRGLPHCHCAFTLKEKWDTVEKVDAYIRAYLPPMSQEEAEERGEIYDEDYANYVKKFMIHTPCGAHNPNAPCMVDGKCKRNFPRPFLEDTVMDDNGFTRPKRPDNGRSFKMKVKGNEIDVDNRWVVPHNPYLLKYMRSHINVEAINSIATVFYVFKYMFKGDDKAFVEMNEFIDNEMVQALNYDEIKSYEDFRYISATEAHWRLSDFWMYRLSHSVDRLAVHLENEQSLYMGEDADDEEMQKAKDKDSKLMAFFKVNQEREKEIANVKEQIENLKAEGKSINHIKVPEKILYNKIGVDHVWDAKNAKWNPRKKTTKPKICRLYNVNPKRTNCFYLRRLLMAVPGPTSFKDLRTVDGVEYPTNCEQKLIVSIAVAVLCGVLLFCYPKYSFHFFKSECPNLISLAEKCHGSKNVTLDEFRASMRKYADLKNICHRNDMLVDKNFDEIMYKIVFNFETYHASCEWACKSGIRNPAEKPGRGRPR